MRKLLALLLIASMPVAGVAQSLAPAPSVNPTQPALLDQMIGTRDELLAAADAHRVPLWSTPDGRILAMVAASGSAYPTLPMSPQIGAPTEWRLVDVTHVVSGGLLLRLTDSVAAHIDLGQASILLPASLPILQCAMDANGFCARSATLAHGGELRLGTNWLAADNLNLDLSYGLSWLRRDNSTAEGHQAMGYAALPGVSDAALPTLIIPGAELANIQNSSISALGRLRLNDTQALDLGASLSRIQLSIPGAAPLTSLNQAALSVGMEYGAFTGTLTGRILSPSESINNPYVTNPRWTGLDVGISWRTPWRGMFSVGAQNLWSSGSVPLLNPPAAREIDPNQARVPYVQYHQDL
jgi:hypothetical protein